LIQGSAQLGCFRSDLIQRFLFLLSLRLPLSWSVKRVNIIGIMLSQSQYEMHISLGDRIHLGCRVRDRVRHNQPAQGER